MLTLLATSAVAAVLCGNQVAVVQAEPPTVVRRTQLPESGIALFAAPDGRLVVPLNSLDATAIVTAEGSARTWEGRLFPLFFDEIDRMLAVFPGQLVTLSYPDRVVIERVPLQGIDGVWRAACSRDGRLAAIVPARDRTKMVLTATRRGGLEATAQLAAAAEVVTAAPDAGFAVAGLADGNLQLVVPGGPTWLGPAGSAGKVTSLAITADGRDLLVSLAGKGAGAFVSHRIDPGKEEPLRLRRVTRLAAPVLGLAFAADDSLFVLTPEGVSVYTRRGRRFEGSVSLEGGTEIVALPGVARSAMPEWSED